MHGRCRCSLTLGLANIARDTARWHERRRRCAVGTRAPKVVDAHRGRAGSAARRRGSERGDVLRRGQRRSRFRHAADVADLPSSAVTAGSRALVFAASTRDAPGAQVSLAPAPRGGSMYFVLAGGRALHAARRRVGPAAPASTIRRRCTSSGCASRSSASFSFLVQRSLDRLDWIFYWGDAIAFALLPPLLLHFTLVFPGASATSTRIRRVGRTDGCCR